METLEKALAEIGWRTKAQIHDELVVARSGNLNKTQRSHRKHHREGHEMLKGNRAKKSMAGKNAEREH